MKNYETLWEGLFILEVKFFCISLLPSFDLSLITAGQAVMTVNITSIQPKHAKVMGINQTELSHLLSHAFCFLFLSLSYVSSMHLEKQKPEKSHVPVAPSPSLFFLIHPITSLLFHTHLALPLPFLSSSCLGLSTIVYSLKIAHCCLLSFPPPLSSLLFFCEHLHHPLSSINSSAHWHITLFDLVLRKHKKISLFI